MNAALVAGLLLLGFLAGVWSFFALLCLWGGTDK